MAAKYIMTHDVQDNFIFYSDNEAFTIYWEFYMPDIKRRNIVKGISIMGAATLSPVSLQAAKLDDTDQSIAIYINPDHGKFKYSLANEIVNTSEQSVSINSKEPVGYKQSNGKTFALYTSVPNDGYVLQPGERLTIYARATKAHPAKAMLIPNSV